MRTMIRQRRRLLLACYLIACLYIQCTSAFVAVSVSKNHISSRPPRRFSIRRAHHFLAPSPLHSLSSPQPQEPVVMKQQSMAFQDIITIMLYSIYCLVMAVLVSWYQDYDVSHMKPQGILRPHAVHGLAYNADSLDDDDDDSIRIHPSYNTVLQHHRDWRIKMWKDANNKSHEQAVTTIVDALQSIQELKTMATNYQWNDMQSLIRQPLLTSQLEEACTVLRTMAVSPEARDEIGFDWGSCAWRHCGAQADAQEALAELYNLIGVLEPFECLFCLDIVERSLHDILALQPPNTFVNVPEYIPYQARGQEDGDSALDLDFLQALKRLRSVE